MHLLIFLCSVKQRDNDEGKRTQVDDVAIQEGPVGEGESDVTWNNCGGVKKMDIIKDISNYNKLN